MKVETVPVLEDNYAYLVIDEASGEAAIVDPSEAEPVIAAAARAGVRLTTVLNTHHHWDHTGGNLELAARCPGIAIIGFAPDAARIPGITRGVAEGEQVRVGALSGQVLFVPCHTSGHVAYLFEGALFSGDTLFAAGCGRFFEGTAAEMHRALQAVIGALPDATMLFCGHEYTEKNLRFAKTLEPHNEAIDRKLESVIEMRRRGAPTVPTTLREERTYNPFLRTTSPELVASVIERKPGVDPSDPVAVLAAVRALKDSF